jgi:hypothetical protein
LVMPSNPSTFLGLAVLCLNIPHVLYQPAISPYHLPLLFLFLRSQWSIWDLDFLQLMAIFVVVFYLLGWLFFWMCPQN